jgi:hypothetical protein
LYGKRKNPGKCAGIFLIHTSEKLGSAALSAILFVFFVLVLSVCALLGVVLASLAVLPRLRTALLLPFVLIALLIALLIFLVHIVCHESSSLKDKRRVLPRLLFCNLPQ